VQRVHVCRVHMKPGATAQRGKACMHRCLHVALEPPEKCCMQRRSCRVSNCSSWRGCRYAVTSVRIVAGGVKEASHSGRWLLVQEGALQGGGPLLPGVCSSHKQGAVQPQHHSAPRLLLQAAGMPVGRWSLMSSPTVRAPGAPHVTSCHTALEPGEGGSAMAPSPSVIVGHACFCRAGCAPDLPRSAGLSLGCGTCVGAHAWRGLGYHSAC
jgi:hypothetical protein